MTTPDLLTTVGFKRTKFGNDERELGYAASKSSLLGMAAIVILTLASLAILLTWTQYEFHFERRRLQHKLRDEGHHAATHLAKVEMELWSHYHDDIHQSHDARMLISSLNHSYDSLNSKLKVVIDRTAKEAGLANDKGTLLADRLLEVLAEQKKAQVQAARHLVDHLIAKGNKSLHLEQHLDKRLDKQMTEESKEMAEAGEESGELNPEANDGANDELKKITTAFFEIYGEFLKFAPDGSVLKEDSALYKELVAFRDRLMKDESDIPPDEAEEKVKELDAKLHAIGLHVPTEWPRYASSPFDFLEVLLMLPKLPRAELKTLQAAFEDGTKDAYIVVAQLRKWEGQKMLPRLWLEASVDKDEEEDEDEEDEERDKEGEGGYEYEGDYEPGADGAADYEPGEVEDEKGQPQGRLRGATV